jgi:hypothetical protein
MTASELAARLDRVRLSSAGSYSTRCPVPAHQDHSPSLTFRDGHRGVLIKCWAGCDLADITAALGLRVSDLFHEQDRRSSDFRRNSRPQDEWAVVWSQTLRRAVEQGRRQAEWAPLFSISDFIRRSHGIASMARVLGTAMGGEDPRAWPLLERAARIEISGLCAEAELDAIMSDGRIDGGRW